jgi:hypothetical protein
MDHAQEHFLDFAFEHDFAAPSICPGLLRYATAMGHG